MKRFSQFLALIIVATLLITACGGPQATTEAPAPTQAPQATSPPQATQPPPAEKTEITVVIGEDPSTLDPQARDDGNERAVNDNVYETLLTRDQDMNIVPHLATEYTRLDDTTWQFKLRAGVTFHNGEPFNADAVVFSVKRIISPDLNSEQLSNVGTIVDAVKVDDLTVNIITDGPDPTLPARVYWLKIVEPKYVQADPDTFAKAPVGTGPYRFVKWERGVEVVVEANPDYWGGQPPIDVVHVRPIQEESTRLAALQSGEVDLVPNLLPEQIDQAPVAVHTPGLEFPIVILNNQEGPLQDVRIRQAINYAVDKEALAEAIYGGYAIVADGQVLTPGHFGYNPDVDAYPYDPDQARTLIQEAGYDGSVIVLESEQGRWLKDGELVEAIAGQLNEVGLNVKVNISEFGKYLDILFNRESRPQMIFVSHDNPFLDADRTFSNYYSCEGRGSSYCNQEVTRLINEGRTEIDVAKREAMYHQVVQITRDEAGFLFLVNFENIYGLSERLNWTPRLDGRVLFATMTLK
jgi:peptide/nickel transport system substrate-binding protein